MVVKSTSSDGILQMLREFIAEQDQIIVEAQRAKSSCEEALQVLEQKLGRNTVSTAIAPVPTPSTELSSNGSTSTPEEKASGVGNEVDTSPKSATGKSTLQSTSSQAAETRLPPESTSKPVSPATGAKATGSKSAGNAPQRAFDAERVKKKYAGQDFYDAARSVMQLSPDQSFSVEELIAEIYGNYTESAFQTARRSIVRRMHFGTQWSYWKRIEKDDVSLFQFDPTLIPNRP